MSINKAGDGEGNGEGDGDQQSTDQTKQGTGAERGNKHTKEISNQQISKVLLKYV